MSDLARMTSTSVTIEPERWNILYRGSLSSCNYDCAYCPFAKTRNTRSELDADFEALTRFIGWVEAQSSRRIGVLFTPWGEALMHRHYQRAIVALSHMGHVERVAIQTNLSCGTSWLLAADLDTVALWTTYHPSQTSRTRFLSKCDQLDKTGARYSVGMVGLREDFDEIEAMRDDLPGGIYLWINAYKDEPGYYRPDEVERLTAIDPNFPTNLVNHPSLGRACSAGHTTFTVDHTGTARRCHFVDHPLGTIYDEGFESTLQPRDCPVATCDCHIGYIHQPELALYELYGEGLLERIPAGWGSDSEHQLELGAAQRTVGDGDRTLMVGHQLGDDG